MNNIKYIKNSITGGHFAFASKKSNNIFVNPMNINTKFELKTSDIVADIGAYVGEYSLFAINNGVKQVISYEPTPETFKVLEKNKKGNMIIINKAVVGNNIDYVDLFISKGIGVTNSIAKSIKKNGSIKVPAIRYEEAVKNATVVKIDVEGAEYSYNIIQPHLRGIIIEFHPLSKKPWREYAQKIMNNLEINGYKCIYRPTFESGWNLTGCWEK
jgi:FkbM family methyltransferase